MITDIDAGLLEKIADLTGKPVGAFNIRKDSGCEARQSTEHIAIDARADGVMTVSLDVRNAPEGSSIEYTLSPLSAPERIVNSHTLALKSQNQTDTLAWGRVQSWECEHPNLYILKMALVSPQGKRLHEVEQRVGFRTVELRPKDGLYVNGTKVVLKGINRHTFHPEGGRCTDRAISLMDAKLIKEMNMNAVRSHYPPDTHFLDICDSLGIFYLDELAGWHGRYDDAVGEKLVEEMVRRDVNHPSVIIWDNGNEGGWNTNLDRLFAEYDPQKRHVIHPWADFDELDTHHYPTFLTGVGRFTNGYKVFMPTEFMHANSDQGGGAGLEDFWANWTSHPLFAGGFIWAFIEAISSAGGRTSRISTRVIFTPHGLVASSTICSRRVLMLSRWESISSSSIEPSTVRMLVIVRLTIACSRLLTS